MSKCISGMVNLLQSCVRTEMRARCVSPIMSGDNARASADEIAAPCRVEHGRHGLGNRTHIERIAPSDVVFTQVLRERSDTGRDDGYQADHRLQYHQTESLPDR